MNRRIRFNLKVITPLIMGGAGHRAELRTQSFNGVFRWWFRAAGGSVEDEGRIFGWAGSSKETRRGMVRLWFEGPVGSTAVLSPHEKCVVGRMIPNHMYGLKYLAFPIFLTGGDRRAIIQDFTFTLIAEFSPMANEEDIRKFLAAAWLAFNLGNFGYRSRRGFGSLEVEGEPEGVDVSLTFRRGNDTQSWIRENLEIIERMGLLSYHDENRPHLKGVYRYMASVKGANPLGTLNRMGEDYKNARRRLDKECRRYFGLPIKGVSKLRRASPVIFKVFGDGSGILVLTGGKFHPEDGRVPGKVPVGLLANALPTGGKIWP